MIPVSDYIAYAATSAAGAFNALAFLAIDLEELSDSQALSKNQRRTLRHSYTTVCTMATYTDKIYSDLNALREGVTWEEEEEGEN